MTKSERLRREAKAYDDAMKRARELLARDPDEKTKEAMFALVRKLCDTYLGELMEGRSWFYHTAGDFGAQILQAYFGADFYDWTAKLANSGDD